MKVIGIIIIIIGLALIVLKGINFQTSKDEVKVGTIEFNETANHRIGWVTYVGVIVVIGGVALTVAGAKSKRKNIDNQR